jgi:hypothetical protein
MQTYNPTRMLPLDRPGRPSCHVTHVVLVGQNLQGGLNDSSPQPQDQVQSRLLLDVVVGKSSSVLELLSGEDQSLLIRGNSLLVLDLYYVRQIMISPRTRDARRQRGRRKEVSRLGRAV